MSFYMGAIIQRPYRMMIPTGPTPGNMFGAEKLRADLAAVREQIAFAVLVSIGRRRVPIGQGLPDVVALRRLEVELITRLDMVGGFPELGKTQVEVGNG